MLLSEQCVPKYLWQRMLGSYLFNRTISILLYENIARSERTGRHCLRHARWLFRRRLAGQLRGRPDRPQKNRYPVWACMDRWLHITMRCHRMHLRFFSQSYRILSLFTVSRYANYWPRYFRCFCWDCFDYHSTLSGRNNFSLDPRSSRLCSTVVYHMGNSHTIFYPVRLLLHRG